jgi:uncharacterized protein (TIGR03083 family)
VQLIPRYGADPVITLDGPPAAIVGPAVRQRRRLAAALASFGEEEWAHPSRCEGWSSRDVVVHLDSTNTFWAHSIGSGLRGEPTELLATFDPVATPAQIVAAAHGASTSEVLDRFVATTDSLVDVMTAVGGDGWSAVAEAPPGHLRIGAVAHHALWDSWVHERDILLPLGLAPDEEPDEIALGLRYVAALGPALAVNHGLAGAGTVAVDVTGPELCFVVDIGDRVAVRAGSARADLRLTGDAVDLLEALSRRRPLDQSIPVGSSWMLGGLAEAFDADPQ